MVETVTLARSGSLAGRRMASVTELAPVARFSFRGSEATAIKLGEAFGARPAVEPCRSSVAGARSALWLGPDEWLLIATDQDAGTLFAALETALAAEPHSLVDVSHRNTGFDIVGAGGAGLLSEGCPLDFDLAAFPVGMCTQTVLGKAEIVLWRFAPLSFRLECWRSFAPYVADFLAQAADNQD
ncbi:sarcosine oxidase subunit gamma [Lichenifustis flavocetrariae]|uniref:Sarcosine oxidase subunit gamma n=1 Tax=Lichenifustis flavocetrariae TaxID=2949735 RepID=A0AA41YXW2_9HYPH|nr:sarcosine oxidase subunit gamma family protein [Lichenifustis flavocetrariae]MCW6510149.1 sarcosine oxidase subunit gamma [Lichenifustis flavocetrariae]